MMQDIKYLMLKNGKSAAFTAVPDLTEKDFRTVCLRAVKEESCRIEAFFAVPENDYHWLIAVLGDPENHGLRLLKSKVSGQFASLTPEYAGFNRFEREIFENYGVMPVGHPALKPLRFADGRIGDMEFFRMEGSAVHEVAVGPVHAGVIEPGHFRFECMGETVYSLEISLGYQHRGLENMLTGGPDNRSSHLIETAAGDSSVAAAINYARLIEALGNVKVDPGVEVLRRIALELERCANHIGDLGALAGDVAFLPTASFCGRIRGEYLNMSAELCGNRFGRNFVVPGSCRYGVEAARAEKLINWLRKVSGELWNALDLMFNSPTVLDRFENTGTVSRKDAMQLGLVGVAARACGSPLDSRKDFPVDSETELPELDLSSCAGDVIARAKVRYLELKRSHEYLFNALKNFEVQAGKICLPDLSPGMIAVSVTEAWRGELCHVALTDETGHFRALKIVDPSFHNWEGLAMALRDEEISNFPICNKSFNLSYCGHDL